MVLGSYGKTYPISDYDIEFWCNEPGAVTIDENGMITAHKRGVYEVEAFVFVDGYWQSQHLMLECGDYVERVSLGRESFNIAEGQTVDIKVSAVLAFAGEVDITNEAKIDIKSNDDSVMNIRKSDDGKSFIATATGKGETTISGTVEYKGETFELDAPAKIITYGTPEGATLPYTEVDFRTGWKNPGKVLDDGGVTISGLPTHTMGIYEGLLAFDLVIDPGHGWPAIAFSDSDTMGSYRNNDCYMIGFREKYIEFQKFNRGVRSMIFGDTLEPIGGFGVPNTDNSLYEYGKRMSIVMGAINIDGGTRVVLNINGENVIDYMDMGEKALNARGYFVVYNPSPGGMTFYPYSGITE